MILPMVILRNRWIFDIELVASAIAGKVTIDFDVADGKHSRDDVHSMSFRYIQGIASR